MRQTLRLFVIIPLLLGLVVTPAFAGEKTPPPSPISPSAQSPALFQSGAMDDIEEEDVPPGELLLADGLVLRPLGMVACGIGLVGSLVTLPFAASSNSHKRVGKALIEQPFEYTFTRPLGDVDY